MTVGTRGDPRVPRPFSRIGPPERRAVRPGSRVLCRPGSADALAEGIAACPDVSWVSVTSGDAFKAMHVYLGSEAECLAFDDPLTDAQIAGRCTVSEKAKVEARRSSEISR
ncbi:MAG: hypothetical protein WAK71_05865 [Streptosporangiaceae bacterium]